MQRIVIILKILILTTTTMHPITHNRDLEATGGIEPPNKGFANPRLNHLATSPASFEYIPLKLSHKPSATASDYTDTNIV